MVTRKTADDDASVADNADESPGAQGEETPLGFGEAPPVRSGADTAQPEKSKPVVLATRLTQALSLPDLGKDGVVITSSGVALSKSDASKAYDAAAECGIELIDKTPAEPEKGDS